MKNYNFLIWKDNYLDGYCVIRSPKGVTKAYQLKRGVSRSIDWPTDVVFKMDDEFPKDIQCADNLYGAGIRVVSERVKNFLILEKVNSLEFLPVTILNHKGRSVENSYFIVNPPYVIECIDIEASQVGWNNIKSDLISRCKQLVLNKGLIPESEVIFRPKYLPTIILIRSDLAKKLINAGFSGFYFKDPLEYKGI